jgi:hypothetical protein
MDINSKHIRSYTTEENLQKALVKASIADHRHLVVWTKAGKCTAVFPQSNLERHGISYMGFYGHYGFMIMG